MAAGRREKGARQWPYPGLTCSDVGELLGTVELAQAVEFVAAHGDAFARARARMLWPDISQSFAMDPLPEVLTTACADQRADGGFPATWSGGRSSLDATCYRLSHLIDFRMDAAVPIDRAARFLASRQREDGSFEEESAFGAAAPPWARPHDVAARIYVTANCAHWLERLGSDPRAVRRGAAYLATCIGSDGRLPSYLHAQWLAAPVLRRSGYATEADRLLWALAYRVDSLGPSALSWLADSIPDEPLALAARARLREIQQSDGRWISEDGPEHDVGTTLAAMRALSTSP